MPTELNDTARARAERRLRAEREIWISTVRPDGQPQSSPVGFLWDGERFLVLSQPGSPKVRNLRDNPRVALHLDIDRDGDEESGGVVTLEATATLDREPLSAAERSAYLAKYGEVMREAGFTEDELFADFSSVIRIAPRRTRVY